MKRFVTTALVAFSFLPALALEQDQFVVSGTGTTTCGDYLAERRGVWNLTRSQAFLDWTNGYVSAYNRFSGQAQASTANLNANTLVAFLDKQCTEYPLTVTAWHITKLIKQLPKY